MMWRTNWRQEIWSSLDKEWDLIVIGGGITGAGILREAARVGMRALLLEQYDFASGTSSRSSKLVHGGLRYLKNLQIRLTYQSVRERERLLKEGRGLVTPLPFLMANFLGDKIPAWIFGIGLTMYDLLALKWNHAAYASKSLRDLCPLLTSPEMVSGYRYFDAQVDDARLVLRVILEAVRAGGTALNYSRVEGLLRRTNGMVCGAVVRDLSPEGRNRTAEVRAKVVVNATGAWADELRVQVGAQERLRILRGSHLFLPSDKLPLSRAVTFLHPKDGRPVFIFPWEGVTLVGTTDVDHPFDLTADIRISDEEAAYLMDSVCFAFPEAGLSLSDVQSTLGGVRAVVNTGKLDPSKESREHVLWNEFGLLSVSGGKLTTFRLMAQSALRMVRDLLPVHPRMDARHRVLDLLPPEASVCADLDPTLRLRLLGRYGNQACNLVEAAHDDELISIAGSPSLWAELRWAARSEGVVHLDDILLRRVRIGITVQGGGLNEMKRIRKICQRELGWDDERWQEEERRYRKLWKDYYSPA